MSVAFPVDGPGGGCVDGGVEGGGSAGGVVTAGVDGCNMFAIAEFWSRFEADREPPPAEAVERAPAAPMNGEDVVGPTAAEPGEITPGRNGTAAFVLTGVVAGSMSLMGSAVVCVTCPAAAPEDGAALGAGGGVAGAVTEATAGRLMNVR